jgi:hypothetical protein
VAAMYRDKEKRLKAMILETKSQLGSCLLPGARILTSIPLRGYRVGCPVAMKCRFNY